MNNLYMFAQNYPFWYVAQPKMTNVDIFSTNYQLQWLFPLPIVMLAVQKDHYNMFAQNEQLQCLLPKMTNFDRLSQKTIKMCIAQNDQ